MLGDWFLRTGVYLTWRSGVRTLRRRGPRGGEGRNPDDVAVVTSVRRWVGRNYTRIVINVNGEVQFDARRLVSPDRLVFDLANARPEASLVGQPMAVEDGF